jgi:hypothetical protein
MQRPGFNTVCADGNFARWGYCANIPRQECQEADSNDADAVIGVGLQGQDCCPMGAGYTNYFVSDNADGGQEARMQVWIQTRVAGPYSQAQYVNAALGKPTSASSECRWNGHACEWNDGDIAIYPPTIVDGITTGGGFHTLCSGERWVQVNMEEVIDVESIRVYHSGVLGTQNRIDGAVDVGAVNAGVRYPLSLNSDTP